MDFIPPWTVVTPNPPVVQATIHYDLWKLVAETRTNARLSVLETSLVVLTCLAQYPVWWHHGKEENIHQICSANPFLFPRSHAQYEFNQFYLNYTEEIHKKDLYAIPIMASYYSHLPFINITVQEAGEYSCSEYTTLNENLTTVVQLNVHTLPGASDYSQVIQAGFDKIRLPPPSIIRNSINQIRIPFIYTIPTDAKLNFSILFDNGKKYNILPNEFTIFETRYGYAFTNLVPEHNYGETAFFIGLQDIGVENFDFIIETHLKNGSVIEQCRHFLVDMIDYHRVNTDQITITRMQSIAYLTIGRFYELHLSFVSQNSLIIKNGSVVVREEFEDPDGQRCNDRKIMIDKALETCGIIGASAFNLNIESQANPGVVIFLNVKKASSLSVTIDIGDLHFESILRIYAFEEESFGLNVDGAIVAAVPPTIKSGSILTAGNPLILRCFRTSCNIGDLIGGWAKFDGWYYFFPLKENNTASINDSLIYYSYHQISSNVLAYDLNFVSLTTNHTGRYSCPVRKFWTFETVQTPSMTFDLIVKEPMKPKLDDGKLISNKPVIKRGGTLLLNCPIIGHPLPQISWHWQKRSKEYEPQIIDYPANTTLKIFEPGVYTCNGSNRFGQTNRTFTVDYEPDYTLPLAIGIPAVVVVLALIAFLIWWLRRRSINAFFKALAQQLKNQSVTSVLDSDMPLGDQWHILPYNRKYEIDRHTFKLTSVIGVGNFGIVQKGEYNQNENSNVLVVAVKTPKDCYNVQQFCDLLKELKLMSQIRPHVNVLQLIGACTDNLANKELFILTEFCEHKSLRDYLSQNMLRFEGLEMNGNNQFTGTPGAIETLLKYAFQASNGMEHLAAENIIHRDLALRNFLLTANHIVKISDFGMSRRRESTYYKPLSTTQEVPIFWMALESLIDGKYTQKSDVWSFGVAMWEIFSCGRRPYPNHEQDFTLRAWLKVDNNRMGPPKIDCTEMYQLMLKCWHSNPDARPTFSECKREIGTVLEQRSRSDYRSLLISLSDAGRRFLRENESVDTVTITQTPVLNDTPTVENPLFSNIANEQIENSPVGEDQEQQEPMDYVKLNTVCY